MRILTCLLALFIVAGAAAADDVFDQLRASTRRLAERKPACPCGRDCQCAPGQCQCGACPVLAPASRPYSPTWFEAAKSGKPVVLFVGCDMRPVGNYVEAITAYEPYFTGVREASIIIAVPMTGGGYEWRQTLPHTTPNADIVQALNQWWREAHPPVVQYQPAPTFAPAQYAPAFSGGGGFSRGGGGGC